MRRWTAFLILALAATRWSHAAEPTAPYAEDDLRAFQQRADELRLDRHPYWQVLLHMASGIRGRRSRVDDPAFFLAASGRTDPRAELHADLAAFFAPAAADDDKAAANRFPARLEWLSGELGIDRARLPVAGSAEFEDVYKKLGPRAATLVFPSAYMSTPASMFGHTLLLVKSQYESTLLSQSINYAAVTQTNNGIVFAFKGIFGLYPGYYSLLPYYQKVQEYSNMDQRDVWEYDLNFTEPEIRRMLLHVWEMRGIWSSYFFFDENCSYNLLYLLDAARPGLDLNGHADMWVIPLDTIKQVRAAGLISGRTWRPSRSTRVHRLAQQMPPEDRGVARALSRGGATPQDDAVTKQDREQQAKMLDLAAEYLQSLRGDKQIGKADYQPRLLSILKARSAIGAPAAADVGMPPPAPDLGHASSRVSLGGGRSGEANYAEIGWRPVYHDLLDPPDGYLVGSQIEFVNTRLRWYEDESHPELDRVDLISLRSFTPRDDFYRAKSWKVDFGVLRQQMGDDGEWHHQGYLNPGVGLCYHLDGVGTVFALVESDVRVELKEPDASIGFGPSAGMITPIGSRVLLNPYLRAARYFGHATDTNWAIGCQGRFLLNANCALGADVERRQEWDFEDTAFSAKVFLYF